MKKSFLIAGCVLALAACGEETKKELGLINVAPDEFSVITRAPLSVPPDYALRPPRPGAARPMEISTKETARQTVFGVDDVSADGVARANDQELDSFLGKIGADKADPNIRSVVDGEKSADNRTTAERLLFLDGSEELGDPIDPNEEYDRLKDEGVIAVKKRNEDIEAP